METIEILKIKGRKYRRIVLRQDIIIRDIEALSYKLASTAGGELADKISTDVEDSLDGTIISSVMDNREDILRQRMSFCLCESEDEIYEVDNERNESDAYEYDLVLSTDFRDRDLKTAARLMSEYITKGTLFDWYCSIGAGQFGAPLQQDIIRIESRIVDIFREPSVIVHGSVPYFPSTNRR